MLNIDEWRMKSQLEACENFLTIRALLPNASHYLYEDKVWQEASLFDAPRHQVYRKSIIQ